MRRKLLLLVSALLLCGVGYFVYQRFVAPTRIALVNFLSYQSSNIILSNKDRFIKFEEVSTDELDKLKGFDFVLIWGMGMKISEEQRDMLIEASRKIPFHSFAVTNPDNDISTLGEEDLKRVSEYLESANKNNYQNLALYVRKYIDKKWFATEPAPAIERKENVYFHLDDELSFNNLKDYEDYLKQHNFYKEGAPRVAVVAGLHEPFAGNKEHLNGVISALQNEGMNVYPFTAQAKRIEFLEEINPDAIVYFPHGQMMMGAPEKFINWIKQKNIPFFTGLSVLTLKEKWEKDPMGMAGGFLGQTVVMPELDGALYPYVVIAQDKNKDGYYFLNAISNRAAKFAKIIHNFTQLKKQANADKKLAIVYFKGVGLNPPVAQGLEVIESLYNFLIQLKKEGYKVDNLPATVEEFHTLLNNHANTYRASAKGEIERFFAQGNPALVEASELDSWLKGTLPKDLYEQVIAHNGAVPGNYLATHKDGKDYLGVARLTFGNVTILPQPPAAISTEDDFKVQHGVKEIPPYAYIGAYLWVQNGLKADALIHFGTHGSLEFTPDKQVTLSDYDWGDILVGTVPHFYYYTIGNIGEAMMAKRRSYGSIISYLTPAFTESDMRNTFNELENTILSYQKSKNPVDKNTISLHIKKLAVGMGLHRDLRLDSLLTQPYTEAEIDRLSNFAEEIATEKINGELYTMGIPYPADKINSTVVAMSADPIAYSVAALHKIDGKVSERELKRKVFFSEKYLNPAKTLVSQVLAGKPVTTELICAYAHITAEELQKAKETMAAEDQAGMPYFLKKQMEKEAAKGKDSTAHRKADTVKGKKPDAVGKATKTKKPAVKKEERKPLTEKELAELAAKKAKIDRARAIVGIEEAITNIVFYRDGLQQSPRLEEKAFFNALNGGYTPPSSGGDAVANPKGVPTGHNLYSVNAESTPSKLAWDRGVALAQNVLNEYKEKHGTYPKKIAYTFWSSEFVETEGATLAQAFYMLGVEPLRDAFGRVNDLRLIPSKELGRPRIDVVVQTSGQLRDLAASRLFLLQKAVEMAADAKDDKFENQVASGVVESERLLIEKGISPKEARAWAARRIFGGVNGNYGTGIQEVAMASDKWTYRKQIAEAYLNNMGAFYGDQKQWEDHQSKAFEAALTRTDVVIQPRQNNTWGALSLDHVFEFMGGMNLTVRQVTGKEPDAYLADYRNHNHMRMQEVKEAIGVESRTSMFNPTYLKEQMKGGEGAAAGLEEMVKNTFGWEVMKPEAIDNEMWDEIFDTYVKDKHNLGMREYFERVNPAALQGISAIMLESARKGMWKASGVGETPHRTCGEVRCRRHGVCQ